MNFDLLKNTTLISCFVLLFTVALIGCSGEVTEKVDASAEALAASVKEACDRDECPCTTPIGSVDHKTFVKVYDVPVVSCTDSCQAHVSEVQCLNGKFDGDLTSKVFTCEAKGCASCSVGGNLIRHGEAVDMFKTAEADCDQSCEDSKQVRKCMNGVFSGDDSFNQFNCAARDCRCALQDGSGYITLGGKIDLYSSQAALCGTRCSSLKQTRTCISNGAGENKTFTLDGGSSFRFSQCIDAPKCYCQLPGTAGEISNGRTVTLSPRQTITCGMTYEEVDALAVTCVGGILRNADTNSVIDVSTANFKHKYLYTPPVCSPCPLKGFGEIKSGTRVNLCSKASLSCSDQKEMFQVSFACENGVLKRNGARYDSLTDPGAPAAWYTECAVNCPGCDTPWGTKIQEGSSVIAYQLMNAVSNTCGRGCRYQQRTCKAGVLDGDTRYNLQSCPNNNCNEAGGGAPARGCLLPWQNSFVTPEAVVPMWSRRKVPCGESCQTYFKLSKCDAKTGFFDAGPSYIYQSCTEICSN